MIDAIPVTVRVYGEMRVSLPGGLAAWLSLSPLARKGKEEVTAVWREGRDSKASLVTALHCAELHQSQPGHCCAAVQPPLLLPIQSVILGLTKLYVIAD